MLRRTLILLILSCLMLVLAPGACASKDANLAPPGELASSQLARDLAPQVSPANAQELVAGNTAFAMDAYQQLIQDGGNLFYSPHSLSTAMSMTYGGARNDTEAQMASALHFTLPQGQLHPAFNWLDLELASRGQDAGDDGKRFRLNITNATFGQIGYEFLPAYLDLLARNHGAGMSLLDFYADPESARQQINEWVSRRTEDRIPELLPADTITDATRLVLVNAVYFNAAWKTPFNEDDTAPQTFHAPGGDVVVPMMSGDIPSARYVAGDGHEAVSLPYHGDELDMVIILPAAGALADFESSLDASALASIFAGLEPTTIHLTMPRFEFRYKLDAVEMFRALGLTDAFDQHADFSGMDGTRNLLITAIAHEAFVNVNEAGAEAAAATGVVVDDRAAPHPLVIDRPFLFLIRDVQTDTILFLGRVLDPSAT